MCDAGSHHLETLKVPIACRDSTDEARGHMIALELHRVERVEFVCARVLFENLVDRALQIGVVRLEQIFK